MISEKIAFLEKEDLQQKMFSNIIPLIQIKKHRKSFILCGGYWNADRHDRRETDEDFT